MSRQPGVRRREWRSGTATWEARWYDSSGKRHTANFDTAAEAEAYRQERLRERRHGGTGDPSGGKITVAEWWERWSAARQTTDSTTAREGSIWTCQIEPRIGAVRLADLRRSDVAAWVVSLGGELAPATVTRCLGVVKKLLTDAVSEGLIAANPAIGVKPPRPVRAERRFLTVGELARLEEAIDPRWAIVVPFGTTTGLRIGELAALRVMDLRLATGEVVVRSTAVSVPLAVSGSDVRRQIHPTKTFAGERTVPTLHPALRDRLAAMIDERGSGPNDWLFTGRDGGPMTPDNWRSRIWRPAVERAGIADPQPTPHSLRHTAVALWIAAGVDRLTVARWAGHTDAGFMERVYGHLWRDDHTDMQNAIATLLGGGQVQKLRPACRAAGA
jgi:integrase